MAHIAPRDVKFLIMNQEYMIIMVLLEYGIQVRLDMKKQLRQMVTKIWDDQSCATSH